VARNTKCRVRLLVLLCGALSSCLTVRSFAHDSSPAVASGTLMSADQSPATPEAPQQSGQKPASAEQGPPNEKKNEATDQKKPPSRGSFVIAPLPVSSPAIGTGIIPVLGYIFPLNKKDDVSPPSTIGAAGLFTNNGTRACALGGELYFGENKYKATAGFAHGNINYDIYGPGIFQPEAKLPLEQNGRAFFGEFLRRTWWGFFLGPRFFDGNSAITLQTSNIGTIQVPPGLGIHTTIRAIGIRLQRDTRPNHFYPTNGTLTDFTTDFFSEAIGSKYSFQSYKLRYNKYKSLSENQVLAFDAYFCGTGGQPPFYGNCIYGTGNRLRGYAAGRYFDRYMMTSQVEYRLALPMRLGLVAFGGIGGVIPGSDQFLVRNSFFLPSGGGGLRFTLSKKYHVNLRADIAQGKDGHVFSMGVGEAF
jgi:hypothetical protein